MTSEEQRKKCQFCKEDLNSTGECDCEGALFFYRDERRKLLGEVEFYKKHMKEWGDLLTAAADNYHMRSHSAEAGITFFKDLMTHHKKDAEACRKRAEKAEAEVERLREVIKDNVPVVMNAPAEKR